MKLTSYLSVALLVVAPFSVMANDVAPVTDADATVAPLTEVAKSETSFLSGFELGVGVSGTSGLNGFVGYANKESSWWLMRRLGVRLDFASTSPISSLIDSGADSLIGDEGYEIDEITIKDVDIDAKHIGAIIDFYPFGDTWGLGAWRISGGYFKGDINVGADLTGNIDGLPAGEYAFSFGGVDYKYTGADIRGTAQIDWDYSGPYLGTGFDIGLFAGFKIYLDAGVVFTDKAPTIDATIPTDNVQQSTDGGATWSPITSAELEAEKDRVISDAQKELDNVKFYPMVKVGFMYRF